MSVEPGPDGGAPWPARGRPGSYVPAFALLATGLGVCAFVGSEREAFAHLGPAPVWVDPGTLDFPTSAWLFDPRWAELLESTTARHAPFAASDEQALSRLSEDLAGLPFVEAIERLEVEEDRGLVVELRFRRPVASIPVGTHFLLVDAEGVVLPGAWPTPVRIDGEPLSVLGPMEDARGIFRGARAGDYLAEDAHLDALDVALSLRAHLSPAERVQLGPVVIDASRARSPDPDDGGTRLLLEGRRMIVFGRSPSLAEPGELSAQRKWTAVARSLALLRVPGAPHDWDLVDVRWDEPEIALRNPPASFPAVVQAVPAPRSATRRGPPKDDGRTRVR